LAVHEARLSVVAPLLREDHRAGAVQSALPGVAAAAHRSGAAYERLLARRRLYREAQRAAGGQAAAVGTVRRGQIFLLPPAVRQGAGDAEADRARSHLLFSL